MDVSAHFSDLDDEEFFVVEGSGWRGRRESDSQVFCHPNSLRDVMSTKTCHQHLVRTTTTTTSTTTTTQGPNTLVFSGVWSKGDNSSVLP